MKKTLKIVGLVLLIFVVFSTAGLIYINLKGIPSYETEKVNFELKSTPESIERGKKLASMLCANCHKNPKTGRLSGSLMLDAPPEFGTIYSANITKDKKHGIANWTDGELVYLFRTGIKKDGKYAPPYMPKLPHMADEDINAIISFLRSDNRMVKATAIPSKKSEPSLLTKFLCQVAFKPLPMPSEPINMPDTTDQIALGKYLVHSLDCYPCHSADFKTINVLEPEKTPGYLGGGNQPLNRKGQVVVTSNLTPDEETGIGSWSEDKFVKALKTGIIEGEHALQYPMVPYVHLTDYEAASIFEYLKTVPPINNKVERIVYE